MTIAVIFQAVDNFHGDGRVDKVGCAHLYSFGTYHEELKCVGC